MPSFTITPVSVESAVGTDFPNFIQFQQDGTDLGLPDADTVNFSTGLTATRGTGESANVLTLVGGASPALVVQLFANTQGVFDGTYFSDWTGAPATASTDASWSDTEKGVVFANAGVYKFQIMGQVDLGGAEWPGAPTWVGSHIPEELSNIQSTVYARHDVAQTPEATLMAWSDEFAVNVAAAAVVVPKLYALITAIDTTPINFKARITVQRLGDAVA